MVTKTFTTREGYILQIDEDYRLCLDIRDKEVFPAHGYVTDSGQVLCYSPYMAKRLGKAWSEYLLCNKEAWRAQFDRESRYFSDYDAEG